MSSSRFVVISFAGFLSGYISAQSSAVTAVIQRPDISNTAEKQLKKSQSIKTTQTEPLPQLPQFPELSYAVLAEIDAPSKSPIDPNEDYYFGIHTNISEFQKASHEPFSPESEEESSLFSFPTDSYELDLLWPVDTRTISSAWGPRVRTTTVVIKTANGNRRVKRSFDGSHKGIDLTAPRGYGIFAAMDGHVVSVGRDRKLGFFVKIDHGDGLETLYGHNSVNLVKIGDFVQRGQIIAKVGSTGSSTGPHVHFEVRINGNAVNPAPWLNDTEVVSDEKRADNKQLSTNSHQKK